jgi:ATP-binding cassette subfamily B protein/subfamily B ATP-binding cassette protein MsbA
MKSLWRAFGLFKPERGRIALVVMLLAAALLFGILKPWPLAWIIDHVLSGKAWPSWVGTDLPARSAASQLLILSAAMLLLHSAHSCLTSLYTYLSIDVGLRGLTRVRTKVFAVLQRLSLRFRHGAQAGDLIFRAATDTYAFQTFFQHGFVTLVTAALYLTFLLAVMWQINVRLTLLALAFVPVLALTIRFFGGHMRRRGVEAQRAESTVTSLLQQGILALPLIQSYTREDYEAKKFGHEAAQARQFKLSQHGWEVLYGLMVSLCLAAGTVGITWLGAHEVLHQRLTLGALLVFLAYLTQMFEPLNQLSYVGATIANATVGIQRVFELLDTPDEVVEQPNARPVLAPGEGESTSSGPAPLHLQGAIGFEDVSFSYQSGLPVLHHVSLTVPVGESAAIIGPSGSGKTTLLNLLPRFFDPSAGRVLIDGTDIRQLRLRDLRSHVAVVLQEPIILPATVAENIAYGRPQASLEEIRRAAVAAHAEVFIEKLPRGYDTRIGEGAAQLSVGERQRINLARAFLKNAPILLMDEPTSALDAESEELIVKSLFNLMKGRTTIMVAHRLTTIRHVDKIIVLEEGRLSEFGAPEMLKTKMGYFARVLSGQSELD